MADLLSALNDEQRRAVTHAGGPLAVLAGAGTGKTRVIVSRFLWLVEAGATPESILALAFSTHAADEMRTRLEVALDRPYEELHVGTFHSFCTRLLREEALELGIDPDFAAVTAADRLAMLSEAIDDLPLRHHEIRGNPAPLIGSFVARIDRLKDELISYADYRRYAHSLAAGSEGAPTDGDRARADRELEFVAVYEHHERLLAERRAIDFGGMIMSALELLREKPDVRERLAERYRHILVDEYQDLNRAQTALLDLLAGAAGNMTVVGDEDQSIYRFRGASGKTLADFEREHPGAEIVRLEQSHRSKSRILKAANAVVEPIPGRAPKRLRGSRGGRVVFWRCRSERAQAQAVAREVDSLLAAGADPAGIAILVRSARREGTLIASALEERDLPHRLAGAAAYFQKAEVRDVLAWLRLLLDPADSGAVVRALGRPPIELRSVDIARLTQLARRRKLDMVAAVATACEGPQLAPEARDRAAAFLRLYRAANGAFGEMGPDRFLHRLVDRIGLRRNQLFAAQPDTIERLMNVSKLSELAAGYMRREPGATAREFARYLTAVAEAGLREEEAEEPSAGGAVSISTMHAAKGLEFDTVFVLGLDASRFPGAYRESRELIPDALLDGIVDADGPATHEAEARRLLHVAMTRAREHLYLSWAEVGDSGPGRQASPLFEEACAAVGGEEILCEEELFGPAEGLHSTFRMMRDEVLDTVAHLGGQLKDLRLDTYVDVSQGIARYLELVKLAALIERSKEGQAVPDALVEVNDLLLQSMTAEQREAYDRSALDEYLRDSEPSDAGRARLRASGAESSLEPFLPRRGDGLMLSASDIETYRICPLKYKFARVFRIPQEPTINQRFGIVIHQVLERFHTAGGGSLDDLMELFEGAWRRAGFGDSNDDLQFHARAVTALRDYWETDRERESEPVSFERAFTFKLGKHLLRGRVDRVDRLPDGGHELIDYKTGRPRTAEQLREDIQLSLYQMGARAAWGMETSAQSYYYVLDNAKVPVEHSERELERVRGTVEEIATGITEQRFEPTPSPEYCPFCDYRIICPAADK